MKPKTFSEVYDELRAAVASAAAYHPLRLVLEIRDVQPPGGLDWGEVVSSLRYGPRWARLIVVAEDDRCPRGWAWYEPGEEEGPMVHQPGDQWRKIAGKYVPTGAP